MAGKQLTPDERWEQGIPHDPRSMKIYKFMEKVDYEENGDSLGLKSGGDGDNGEQILYLLDCFFDREGL